MSLVHVGIRPKNKVVRFNQNHREVLGYKYELFPDGSYKLWSNRQLESGCNNVVDENVRMNDLIYCPYCDEYFSRDQFIHKDS